MDTNWPGILVAGVVPMVLGMLWYSPAMFARRWMGLLGKSKEQITQGNAVQAYLTSLLASLVMAYVLDQLIYSTLSWTMMKGMKIGFAAWVGFVATTSSAAVTYEGKPFELYLINGGYNLVCMLMMGAIIGGWQ